MPLLIVSIDGVEIRRVPVQKERTTLGRHSGNDIVLTDSVVSGRHCVFELEGGADVFLEDLGSTNGTYLNGQMLHSQRPLLRNRDVVGIGRFRLQFLSEPEFQNSGETNAMPLDTALGGLPELATLHARLRLLSGSSAGLEVPVVKAVTTFGKPGVAVVAISHRHHGYDLALVDGAAGPMLNGKLLTADAVPLCDRDVIELAGTQLQFLLRP